MVADDRGGGRTTTQAPPASPPDPGDGAASNGAPAADAPPELTEEEQFRISQRSAAEAQNLSDPNAVPEKRPIASQQVEATASPLTERLIKEGAIPGPNDEPMPKEAYDAADDEDRKRETAEQGVQPAPHAGTVINVLSGPHRGRRAAVLRVISYPTVEDRVAKEAGGATADYIVPKEIEVSFRGDARDGERAVLDLTEVNWELVPTGFAGRPAISGAL